MTEIPTDRYVFSLPIQVVDADIDELNHVNNIVYLRWVQEVSYAHWNSAASPEIKVASKWVVLKHEINYHAPALPGDEVTALTWIEIPEGPRQKRHVFIQRSKDQKLLASAVTTWCLLDPTTGRPKRVSTEVSGALGLKK